MWLECRCKECVQSHVFLVILMTVGIKEFLFFLCKVSQVVVRGLSPERIQAPGLFLGQHRHLSPLYGVNPLEGIWIAVLSCLYKPLYKTKSNLPCSHGQNNSFATKSKRHIGLRSFRVPFLVLVLVLRGLAAAVVRSWFCRSWLCRVPVLALVLVLQGLGCPPESRDLHNSHRLSQQRQRNADLTSNMATRKNTDHRQTLCVSEPSYQT